jgi:hypothetical protein
VLAILSTVPVVAGNWPRFRGTQGGLAADHPSLPARWSQTENVVWKINLPGRSWSSPVVWGDHVFVTAVVNVTSPFQPLKPVPEYRGRSWNGPLDETSIATTSDAHRWMLYDVDGRNKAASCTMVRCLMACLISLRPCRNLPVAWNSIETTKTRRRSAVSPQW